MTVEKVGEGDTVAAVVSRPQNAELGWKVTTYGYKELSIQPIRVGRGPVSRFYRWMDHVMDADMEETDCTLFEKIMYWGFAIGVWCIGIPLIGFSAEMYACGHLRSGSELLVAFLLFFGVPLGSMWLTRHDDERQQLDNPMPSGRWEFDIDGRLPEMLDVAIQRDKKGRLGIYPEALIEGTTKVLGPSHGEWQEHTIRADLLLELLRDDMYRDNVVELLSTVGSTSNPNTLESARATIVELAGLRREAKQRHEAEEETKKQAELDAQREQERLLQLAQPDYSEQFANLVAAYRNTEGLGAKPNVQH